MKTVFWSFVWALFCITVVGLLVHARFGYSTHTGTDITLVAAKNNQLAIIAESVTIEAASSDFFVLRQSVSGDEIIGLPTHKPLGWEDPDYFKSGPTTFKGSNMWGVVIGDNITIHATGHTNITIQQDIRPSDRAVTNILWIVMGVIFWFGGLRLGMSK